MSDKRKKKFEEQALDSLLIEALGNVGPPDLSERILARASKPAQDDDKVAPVVSTSSSRTEPAGQRSWSRRRLVAVLAGTAGLAASVMMAVSMLGDNDPESLSTVAVNEPTVVPSPVPSEVDPGGDATKDSSNVPSTPPRGIPLVMNNPGEDSQEPGLELAVDSDANPTATRPLSEVTLVSKQVDSDMRGYWSAIGIEPSGEAEAKDVVKRLESVLGVKLPSDAIDDPIKLQAELARRKVAVNVARRWLQKFSDRGLNRLSTESQQQLVDDLAASLQGKRPFDETIVSWLDGTSPLSSSFYGAVSHSGNDAMARRLAALTMNVDVRCIRCHDSKIERNGLMQDYRGFAALLSQGVSRDAEGQYEIDPKPVRRKEIYYELADGRQQLAEPIVPASWLGDSADQPVAAITDWANELVGSEALARGTINSLWQLVHGQPLRGRVVDPISAPHNDELDRLEDHLVQDLVDSRFNVARSLALIIASPSTRRSVPSPLRPENALVVSEEESSEAKNAVNAFAAALPRHTGLPFRQRLDQTMRAMGVTLDQDGQPFVAQIGSDSEKSSNDTGASTTKKFADDFPIRGESLPAQWLTLIGDEQSQIDHLGYLAGMKKLPENISSVVEVMKDDDKISKELMLNRVWWLVQP